MSNGLKTSSIFNKKGNEGLSVLDGVVSDYGDSYICEVVPVKKVQYFRVRVELF